MIVGFVQIGRHLSNTVIPSALSTRPLVWSMDIVAVNIGPNTLIDLLIVDTLDVIS